LGSGEHGRHEVGHYGLVVNWVGVEDLGRESSVAAEAQALAVGKPLQQQRRRLGKGWLPYALILPILVYEIFFIVYPIYEGMKLSLYRQPRGGKPMKWVGLDNYSRMLRSDTFWGVMQNTAIFTIGVIIIAVGFGLGSALLLNRHFPGRTMARAMMMIPWAFPDVPAVLTFIWMLNPNFGVMNVFARWLPWVDTNPTWLLDQRLAMISVILITAWKGFPFYSLVILSALQTVSQDLMDAARVDGASKIQVFRSVTLPAISPTLLLLVVLALIFSFKQFTIIFLLTGGGPAGATETIVIRVYNTAFRFYDFNYAAALGVAGFVMALTIALVFIMIQRHQEMEMA
jgi:multiple sugar transport system permease protein